MSFFRTTATVIGLCLVLSAPPSRAATRAPSQVGQWDRFELTIENDRRYTDPYHDVTLDVVYKGPDGRETKFWGFHDGGTTWKVRFMPDRIGTWEYRATFSDGAPAPSGKFRCVRSNIPGMVAVDEGNPLWFGWKGGKRFLVRSFHVGDRFFAANWPAAKRTAFLGWAVKQGYNTLSIASHYVRRDDETRGKGWDIPTLWPLDAAEYRELEVILDDLARRRLVVFPFAGFFGRMGDNPTKSEDRTAYLRYAIARLGPYWNGLFNVGGPEPLLAKKEYLTIEEIHQLGGQIRSLDVFGHPLTQHNPTGDDAFKDAPWLTFGTLQGPKTVDLKKLAGGLTRNHHRGKPLYAQETLWSHNEPQMKQIGRDYTDDELRKNAYVINFSAAALNFGDMHGNSSTGFSGTLQLAERNQARHDIVKRVWDFMETIPFNRMSPCPEKVDAGFCLGEEGKEYLVYLPSGGPVSLSVAPGPYKADWMDARDPRRRRPGPVTSDGKNLSAPDGGDDWILRLRSSADRRSPPPPTQAMRTAQ